MPGLDMQSEKQFINALEDIHEREATSRLLSDRTQVEISTRVVDLLGALHIGQWQSGLHQFPQNLRERHYQTLYKLPYSPRFSSVSEKEMVEIANMVHGTGHQSVALSRHPRQTMISGQLLGSITGRLDLSHPKYTSGKRDFEKKQP